MLARAEIDYGWWQAIIGVMIALGIGIVVPIMEKLVRPRWRDRILIRVARFDYDGGTAPLDKPLANVLRAFGEQSGRAKLDGEDDVAYCHRVFGVEASAPSSA